MYIYIYKHTRTHIYIYIYTRPPCTHAQTHTCTHAHPPFGSSKHLTRVARCTPKFEVQIL